MNENRPLENLSANMRYPMDRLRHGVREVFAAYEREIRERRANGTRSSGIAPADITAPSDRVIGRIWAVVTEHENMLRQERMMWATRAKARTGRAVRQPPTGYLADRDGRWRMDPDPVVRETITRVFRDFERLGTVGRVSRYYIENRISLPVRQRDSVRWVPPFRRRIYAILTHPAFRGDYVFGRRVTRGGRTCRQPNAHDVIVVPEHHEAYLSLDCWERVQAQLRRNRRFGK